MVYRSSLKSITIPILISAVVAINVLLMKHLRGAKLGKIFITQAINFFYTFMLLK
jgi:hypothetical protein